MNTTNHVLKERGILEAAQQAGWVAYQFKNAPGWSYPVIGLNGDVTGRRWKAQDREARELAGRKYAWLPTKPKNCVYYVPAGAELQQAISNADGVVWIANGESSALALSAAGFKNVLSWFGESSVPETLGDDLLKLGVRTVNYPADRDDAGLKSAKKVHTRLKNKPLNYRPLQWGEDIPEKGDANDAWIIDGFDTGKFATRLENLQALILPAEEPVKPRRIPNMQRINESDYERAIEQLREQVGNLLGCQSYDADGWSKPFCNPLREDHNASAGYNIKSGVLNDFIGRSYKLKELAEFFGLDYPRSQYAHPKKAGKNVDLSKSPDMLEGLEPVKLEAFEADLTVNHRYITEINTEALVGYQGIVIKSPLATGKTSLVKRLVMEFEADFKRKPDVLVITHLQALAENIADRLEMELYKNIEERIESVPQLVISYNSLYKIGSKKFDIVVIDETEQFHRHLSGGTMRGAEAKRAYESLKNIVSQCDQFIALDAHMTNTTKRWTEGIVQGRVIGIENSYRHQWGGLTIHKKEETVISAAFKAIEQSRGVVVIPTTSKVRSETYYKAITDRFGTAGVMMVNGDNSESKEVQALIKHINEALPSLRVLICSPSLATGIDVQAKVAGVYGVFLNRPLIATDMLQMLGRFRNADERHVYIQSCVTEAETDWREIYQMYDLRAETTGYKADFSQHSITAMDSTQRSILKLQAMLQADENRQRSNILSAFVHYARAEGFTLTSRNATDATMRQILKDAREQLTEERKQAILKADPVSHEELEVIRMQGNLTTEHRRGNSRYKIEDCVGLSITSEIYDDLHKPAQRRALRRFTDLEEGQPTLQERDRLEASEGHLVTKRNHYTVTRQLVADAINAVFPAALNDETRLSEETVNERLSPFLDRFMKDIQIYIDGSSHHAPDDLSNRPLAIFRRILKAVGMKLDRRRVMEDGVRFWQYSIDRDHLLKMQRYARARRAHIAHKQAERNDYHFSGNTHINSPISGKLPAPVTTGMTRGQRATRYLDILGVGI